MRMGQDKSILSYHGKPQGEHLLELVSGVVKETYVSVRKGQKAPFTDRIIEDAFEAKGPLNGLLSAHEAFPKRAWLALAVDMPFIAKGTVERLIAARDKSAVATAMVKSANDPPEPLVTIWEPWSLESLKEYYAEGKVVYPTSYLSTNAVKSVVAANEWELFNVNDPSDFEKASSRIRTSC